MKRFLFLGLVVLFLARCDSAGSFEEPGWFGSWNGEIYNDMDPDGVNGPTGRVDSLAIKFIHDGDMGFYVDGDWTTKFAVLDDYDESADGPVKHITFNAEHNWEEVTFDLIVGKEQATAHYKFLCWTNGADAPRGNLTCMRLFTAIDGSGQEVFPPKFKTFYLKPTDG